MLIREGAENYRAQRTIKVSRKLWLYHIGRWINYPAISPILSCSSYLEQGNLPWPSWRITFGLSWLWQSSLSLLDILLHTSNVAWSGCLTKFWPRRWKKKAAGSSRESFGFAAEKPRCSQCQFLSSVPTLNMARSPQWHLVIMRQRLRVKWRWNPETWHCS